MELRVEVYCDNMKEKWDTFVLKQSVNGTFLQSKQFLDYHKDRFQDTSLMIMKSANTLIAVIPACTIVENRKKIFSAHKGSTFGGIVIGEDFYDIEHMEAIMNILEQWFKANRYDEVWLKCTSDIFAKGNNNLLYYFLFQRGYESYDEMSSYIDFLNYKEDVISNFSYSRRRDYKYSMKHNMEFKRLETADEIAEFYEILCGNLKKFDTKPIHSLEELCEFKEQRLPNVVEFYGVIYQSKMIAGSMVFNFDNRVFHTQYLAADQSYLKMFPMNFLDTNLIIHAKERGFRYFSFGTSTEEKGKVLNKHLAQFKEGFGTEYGINKNYVFIYK